MYPPPEIIAARPFASLPERFKGRRDSSWGRINFAAHALTSFLEGPSFDRSGNLYVVDIPFGRIFRIRPDAAWDLVAEYDGWPNGLKVHPDGYLVVADYRRGILRVDPATGAAETVLDSYRCEGFKGCNDLYFGPDGALYFTDQGQTGLQDPTGRVYRWSETRGLDCLIGTVPSPNGLVLNRAGTHLLVAATRANAVWRLPLMQDGGVSKVGLFVQLSGGAAGPDGLALDIEGGLCVCHVGIGVWRFDARGRPTHLVEAPADSLWTNIAFGGADGRELFITDSGRGTVLSALMPYPGQPMASHATRRHV
ncbi:gluconolactonase [Methylobacterium brachiatum]|uniref:Gluconolactonase n=1 Tax=Methylobacterium brachiatum TaxID=269660 RepID=A0AAJ1TTP9_9HYPH|nr:SMP-30/gluconolactonase/LRE family protein [Methylobacterium brachiatum]MCB4805574.1 SMP-30/gluconolactonase/LRE family protein [Methylobacterium brachiatum]MDQ0546776.1 gluconolactonase [Methylobacterium brachiatum]